MPIDGVTNLSFCNFNDFKNMLLHSYLRKIMVKAIVTSMVHTYQPEV